MKGLGKVHQPDHVVLKDIWLSFLPGAKIGVLGLNGSGKSTLLRIMAGEDQQLRRRGVSGRRHQRRLPARRSRGSIAPKTVLGNVEEGVAEIRALLTRYDEINAKFGEELSPEEMDKVLEEQGKVQDRIEAANGWDLDSRLELAMDALRLPPPDADVTTLSGGERRRVALCRLLLQVAGPAAPRRADEPPRRRIGRLARALPEGLSRDRRRRHARSLLPRQRRRLDPRARSRLRHPVGRQLLVLAGAEAEAPGARGEAGNASGSARCSASWTGSACRRARGRPRARRGSTPTKTCCSEETAQKIEQVEIYIPPGPRLGDIVVEARGLRKGYGDLLLMDDVNFTLPRGGIVGVIGPNGAGKTTLFRMITGQEQPDAGTLRLGETVQGRLRRSVARRARGRQERVGGDHRRATTRSSSASARSRRAPTCRGSTSRAAISSARSARCRAASATACTWPSCSRAARNLLLLDEPTNDLDVDTLRALEEALLVVCRLRRRHQPRSLVPRSHRDAHAGVRRGQQGGVVRGQLPGLRGRSPAPARRRGGSAAPHQVPEADAVAARHR